MGNNMRVLGLDIGTKNIGVAISDETCVLAQGKEVILRKSNRHVVEKIKDIVEEFHIEKIVVGLPINMNGTKGVRARDSERFAELLKESIIADVILWDERLSTKEAEDVMIEGSLSRAKRKKIVDKLAAQIILQNYLDSETDK